MRGLRALDTAEIVLTDLRPGTPARIIGAGESPVWSPDGRYLFFQQRIPAQVLGTSDNSWVHTAFRTSIMRARADGTGLTRLITIDAYTLGPLRPTTDGRSLIFSRIDNPWDLWRHRLPDGTVPYSMVGRYGPKVSIQRFNIARRNLTVLVRGAGRPGVQP